MFANPAAKPGLGGVSQGWLDCVTNVQNIQQCCGACEALQVSGFRSSSLTFHKPVFITLGCCYSHFIYS